jgi:hypothetical protein
MGKFSSIYFRYKAWISNSIVLLAKEKENAESIERRKGAHRIRAQYCEDNEECERYKDSNETFNDESRY